MTDHAFTIIIPARYASSRLAGKPLLLIKGKPLLQHVFETAQRSQAHTILIATDDDRIATVAENFGAMVAMTSTAHQSGTDRLAEIITQRAIADSDIIVNLQGDEYGLSPKLLDQVAANLAANQQMHVATLCEPITTTADYHDPNVVKVVFDANHGAMYFSRSPIPANRSGELADPAFRHIGLYAYRAGYLKTFTELAPCALEQSECLEQLRMLYYGGNIHVGLACDKTGIGIDTAEDLALARGLSR